MESSVYFEKKKKKKNWNSFVFHSFSYFDKHRYFIENSTVIIEGYNLVYLFRLYNADTEK